MRKAVSILIAALFLVTLLPSAYGVETPATRSRVARRNSNYGKLRKSRKAPKAKYGIKKHRARRNS